jgi:hypothetical protein
MKWTSSRNIVIWWSILLLLVIGGYTYRQPIKLKLINITNVHAPSGYQGVLQDSYTSHINAALCLNKHNKNNLPKETMGELENLPFLFNIKSSNLITVGFMEYSFPALQAETKETLDDLAKRFRKKIEKENIPKVKLILTSMTRSRNSQRKLLKKYPESPLEAPHLYGYTFNVSFKNYQKVNTFRSSINGQIYKKLLEDTLIELRKDKKIWVTGAKDSSFFMITLRCSF